MLIFSVTRRGEIEPISIDQQYSVNGIYLFETNKCDIWFLTLYLIRIFYRFFLHGDFLTNFSLIFIISVSVVQHVIPFIDLMSHAFIYYALTNVDINQCSKIFRRVLYFILSNIVFSNGFKKMYWMYKVSDFFHLPTG